MTRLGNPFKEGRYHWTDEAIAKIQKDTPEIQWPKAILLVMREAIDSAIDDALDSASYS